MVRVPTIVVNLRKVSHRISFFLSGYLLRQGLVSFLPIIAVLKKIENSFNILLLILKILLSGEKRT